jgi:YbbR domain-containing protein
MKLKSFRKIFKNWQVKLYMIILAFFLWIFVVTNQNYETTLNVPLQVVDLRPGKVLISDLPEFVRIRYSGSGKDLLFMKYIQQGRFELDIHTINYFYDYPLLMEFLVIPPGLNVEPLFIIEPDTVIIRLEDELLKRVPVRPLIEAEPSAGHVIVGNIRTIPDSVTLSGPRTLVRRVRYVETEEMNLTNLSETIQIETVIQQLDPKIIIIPSIAIANINIEKIGERTINRIQVKVINVPPGRRIILEPSTIDLEIKGPTGVLARMTSDSVNVVLDLSNWIPNIRDYSPEISVPDQVEYVGHKPDRVRVRVEVE